MLDGEYGDIIDAASMVVRVNRIRIGPEYAKHTGTKTTVWFAAKNPAKEITEQSLKQFGVKHVVVVGTDTYHACKPACTAAGVPLELYPPERHALIGMVFAPPKPRGDKTSYDWEIERGYRPSTGMLAIDWMLNCEHAPVVATIGIDGIFIHEHYYGGQTFNHSPEYSATELAFYNCLRLYGKVRRLQGDI